MMKQSVEKITTRLGILAESADEASQLKILQALLALVTTIVIHADELRNILGMSIFQTYLLYNLAALPQHHR